MLIPINRIYLERAIKAEVMINTRYIIEVVPTNDKNKPRTRIIMERLGENKSNIIYTNTSVQSINKIIKDRCEGIGDRDWVASKKERNLDEEFLNKGNKNENVSSAVEDGNDYLNDDDDLPF